MDRNLPLPALLKLRDGLQDNLRKEIRKGEISPDKRAQMINDLAAIQRRIERLK